MATLPTYCHLHPNFSNSAALALRFSFVLVIRSPRILRLRTLALILSSHHSLELAPQRFD